jgi:hypothetical protein
MTQGDNPNNEVFSFEHAMSHRTFFGVMSPLTRFSVLPYFLDPMDGTNLEAGNWHLNHQQAHDDAYSALPQYYSAKPIGIPGGSILVNVDFDNADAVKWWEFTNMVEHQVLTATILPSPSPNIQWTYPFW